MTTLDPSIQATVDYASPIHPNGQYEPADFLPGGKHQPPAGLRVDVDPASERVFLWGPYGEEGAQVKTLSPWGGGFKIQGMDFLRALAQVLRVGEPSGRRTSMEDKRRYFMNLLATAEPFTVPDAQPMTREQMERFIDRDPSCQRALPAFTDAVNGTGRMISDGELKEFIQRATDGPDAAILHYNHLRDGRRGVSTAAASAKPARRRTAMAATEV